MHFLLWCALNKHKEKILVNWFGEMKNNSMRLASVGYSHIDEVASQVCHLHKDNWIKFIKKNARWRVWIKCDSKIVHRIELDKRSNQRERKDLMLSGCFQNTFLREIVWISRPFKFYIERLIFFIFRMFQNISIVSAVHEILSKRTRKNNINRPRYFWGK